MERRQFISIVAAAVTWPLTVQAQQLRRVGVLLPYMERESQAKARVAAFQASLAERGWVGDHNVQFDYRYAEGRLDQLPALAADLANARIDVIVTVGSEATDAARKATVTTPIVMATVGDPVAAGYIASLARPGGNITGASLFATELTAKRVELLKEALPSLSRLAVMWGPNNASVVQKFKQVQAAATVLQIPIKSLEVRAAEDIERSFDLAAQFGAEALMTTEDAIQITNRARIVEFAKRQQIPVASEFGDFAHAGALMTYGPNILDSFRSAAGYVDKILKGVKPADLPVAQPTKFELILNLKTARTLGLTIPPTLIARADEVIE
ncbi:MAG: ABC transporter substrate-binding protein [Bradyrhizobium sp.]|jgi:putative ABC transport system substrate-binding protein